MFICDSRKDYLLNKINFLSCLASLFGLHQRHWQSCHHVHDLTHHTRLHIREDFLISLANILNIDDCRNFLDTLVHNLIVFVHHIHAFTDVEALRLKRSQDPFLENYVPNLGRIFLKRWLEGSFALIVLIDRLFYPLERRLLTLIASPRTSLQTGGSGRASTSPLS